LVPPCKRREEHRDLGTWLGAQRRGDHVVEHRRGRVRRAEGREHDVDRVARLRFEHLEPAELRQRLVDRDVGAAAHGFRDGVADGALEQGAIGEVH
jgi:hypothetical protein